MNFSISYLKKQTPAPRMEALSELPDAGRSDCREPEMAPKIIECTTFHDKNTSGDDFAYDANGNMIQDKNKGIEEIHYNHLNLPQTVILSSVEGDSLLYY